MNKFWRGFWFVFAFVLVFVFLFWFFSGGLNYLTGVSGLNNRIQSSNLSNVLKSETSSFNETFGSNMINYTDYTYGFTVSYPKGYEAENFNSSITSSNNTIFSVDSVYPGFFPETLTISIFNGSAENFYTQGINSLNDSVNHVSGFGDINGFYELGFDFPLNASSGFENEVVFGRQAFFDCSTPLRNNYVAVITFLTPDVLKSDLSLADFIFSTFKC